MDIDWGPDVPSDKGKQREASDLIHQSLVGVRVSDGYAATGGEAVHEVDSPVGCRGVEPRPTRLEKAGRSLRGKIPVRGWL